jgi:hypothetical protein
MTAKVPIRLDGEVGLGTPTLALPIKRYFNLDGRSGSWTLSPHWFVPIASSARSKRKEQVALTAGYETESYRAIGGLAVGVFRRVDDLFEAHLHGAAGVNLHGFGSSGHLKFKMHLGLRDDGAQTLRIGPTLYWRFSDRWHGQIVYKHTVLAEGYSPRYSLRTGVAVVY